MSEIKHKRFECECGHQPSAHFKREFVSVCATCEQVGVMRAAFAQSKALLEALGHDNEAVAAGLRWNSAIVTWLDSPEGSAEQAAAFARAQAALKEAQEILLLQSMPDEPNA